MTDTTWADEWATHVRSNPDLYRMGTVAYHALCDIGRDPESVFRVDVTLTDDDNYYGNWLTGFGFVNVRFPKATTRELTADEVEWLAEHPVVIA